jgi:hypothetical protein
MRTLREHAPVVLASRLSQSSRRPTRVGSEPLGRIVSEWSNKRERHVVSRIVNQRLRDISARTTA